MRDDIVGIIKKIFLAVLLGIIFFLMGKNIWANWDQLAPLLRRISIPLALLCILSGVLNYCFISLIWMMALRYLKAELSYAKSVRIFAFSMMGRYVPGKVWSVMGRIYLAEREGVPKSSSLITIYLEIALQMVFGFLLFIGSFYLYGGDSLPDSVKVFFYVLPVILLFLHPKIFEKGLNRALRIAKKEPVKVSLSFGNILGLGFFYTAHWLVQGVGIYCALSSFYMVDFALVPLISGIFAFSWLMGFLALIVPSGIGVREGMMSLLLGMWVPMPIAVTLAILVRFLFTISEGVFYLFAFLGQKEWRNKQISQVQGQIG